MDTVTLYRINCYHAPREELIGESFSLVPWDEDDATMKGEDDGGKDYELPKGYELSAEDGVPVKTIRYCGVAHAFIDKLGFVPQAEDLCIEIAKAMKEM